MHSGAVISSQPSGNCTPVRSSDYDHLCGTRESIGLQSSGLGPATDRPHYDPQKTKENGHRFHEEQCKTIDCCCAIQQSNQLAPTLGWSDHSQNCLHDMHIVGNT